MATLAIAVIPKAVAAGGQHSDIRLKRDIEALGTLANGLPLYRFKYLWSDTDMVGVMV